MELDCYCQADDAAIWPADGAQQDHGELIVGALPPTPPPDCSIKTVFAPVPQTTTMGARSNLKGLM